MGKAKKGRRNPSVRTRFAVMQRDDFTCRYCGRRPPDIKLVLDHVIPVAAGGGNEAENLVTSCSKCNAGKSDKLIDEEMVPPISEDVERRLRESLERQRRILELHRELQRVSENIAWEVTVRWAETFGAVLVETENRIQYEHPGVHFPNEGTVRSWVDTFGLDVTLEAISATGRKFSTGTLYRADVVRYVWGVCRRMQEEAAE